MWRGARVGLAGGFGAPDLADVCVAEAEVAEFVVGEAGDFGDDAGVFGVGGDDDGLAGQGLGVVLVGGGGGQ